MRGPAAAIATAGVVVALDQATKQLVDTNIARGDDVSVFPGLGLTNTRNTGWRSARSRGAARSWRS